MATWRAIAEQLAARLQHHAFCPTHELAEADESCPFCRDRAAWLAYRRKANDGR